MKELRDPSTLHEWLCCISPKCGTNLNSVEFIDALRLRVGAIFSDEGIECRKCGNPTDSRLLHAQCCDRANATKGHYKVRDCVHALNSVHDPSAQLEVIGLSPSYPLLRPANILCSGPTGLVALDINVSSPFSQSAGEDCCDASFRRKERDYGHVISELASKGITFTPLCFSSYGRLHSEVKEWLEFSSRAAARRRGIVDFRPLLGRTRRNLAVVIQRRLVDQVRACLPHSEVELESIFRDLDHAATC